MPAVFSLSRPAGSHGARAGRPPRLAPPCPV